MLPERKLVVLLPIVDIMFPVPPHSGTTESIFDFTLQFFTSIYKLTMTPPPGSAHSAFGLGGLVLIGGTVGFLKKNSKASLGAGLVFGGLLIGSGIMISQGDHVYEGHLLACGTSGVMTLAMGQRFLSTGKFMPSGVIAMFGAVSTAYHMKKAFEWSPKNE